MKTDNPGQTLKIFKMEKGFELMMRAFMSNQSPHQMMASILQGNVRTPQSDYYSPQDLERDIAKAKSLYESMQERKGKKAPGIPDFSIIASHRMQRERMLNTSDDQVQMINTSTFDVYHSKVTDLGLLAPILIKDLLLETWHKGRYLLCRTIEDPYRTNAVMTIVEDQTGKISILSLYNYTKHITDSPDPYLPVNTILVIKEPYFKATASGAAMVRCDSPSDVIVINYKDDNYKKLNVSQIRNWEMLCSSADRVHKFPIPTSALEWKSRGDALCKQGHMADAIRAYSLGLKIGSSHDEEKSILVNRAATFLTWGRFDAAAKDAIAVLDFMPLNVHALSAAARSFYLLRAYEKSLMYYERLVQVDDSYVSELTKTRQRLKEQSTGDYDWDMMRESSKSSKAVRLDVADYFNHDSIEICFISKEKGRGVIAKKDIPPGTMLIVCKAFAISFAEELKSVILMNISYKRKVAQSGSQFQLITSIIHKLLECPSTASSFYKLWTGKGEEGHGTGDIVDLEGDQIIDYEEIEHISSHNAFCRSESLDDECLSMESLERTATRKGTDASQNMTSGTGIWVASSFFNHSCLPNTNRWFIGDVMVLVNNRFIQKGEELTVTYNNEPSYEKRQEKLLQYGFSCKCPLCSVESRLDYDRLLVLKKRFHSRIAPRIHEEDFSVIPKLEKLIDEIKEVYARNSQNQFLFELVDPMAALSRLYQAKGKIAKCVEIDEKIFKHFTNIKDVESYIKGQRTEGEIHLGSSAFLVVIDLIHEKRRLGLLNQAAKWAEVLIMFSRLRGLNRDGALRNYSRILDVISIK